MIIQTTNISTLLNSVLTTFTGENVVYKTKPDPILTNNLQRFFELTLPEGINKAHMKYLLITVCKKTTPLIEEYCKPLDLQTEHFILRPLFEDECLKFRIENIDNNTEEDIKKTPYKIGCVKEEFNEQKGEKEREAFIKIFEAKKNKLENTSKSNFVYYEPDKDLEIYLYFEKNYIANDLEALLLEQNVEDLFGKIVDSLFNEGLLKEDILNCAYLYFKLHLRNKNNDWIFMKYEKNKPADISKETCFLTNKFRESLTSDHLKLFKKYLKNILNLYSNDNSVTEPVNAFKKALEKHYNENANSFNINVPRNFGVEINKYFTQKIPFILKMQYFYFYEVLKEVHHIVQTIKQAAKNITEFNETDIEKLKGLLTTYQKAFGDEAEDKIFQFIETLKTKLNEAVEENDPNTIKHQLDLYDAMKDGTKVIQFTLIFNGSKYVYPQFYTFSGDALNPIEDAADVEVYKIINELGTEEQEGSKGDTGAQGPKGDKGAPGVNGTPSELKTNLFLSFPYQIFLILYLISITGLVVYLILRNLKQPEFK